MSAEGSRSSHSFRPRGEEAYSASWEMILSYSKVFNAFVFIDVSYLVQKEYFLTVYHKFQRNSDFFS